MSLLCAGCYVTLIIVGIWAYKLITDNLSPTDYIAILWLNKTATSSCTVTVNVFYCRSSFMLVCMGVAAPSQGKRRQTAPGLFFCSSIIGPTT